MREGRWETVTESEFQHEHRGLEAIRERLPDSEPWRAWSNFTFTANSGHVREVDLLVVAPGGVYLVELKDWHGSVESRNGSWLQTQPGGRQVFHGNPLHLANKKARELGDLLRRNSPPNSPTPWVSEAVCFTDSGLRLRLPAHDQHGVYTVPELVELLKRPPREERHRIDASRSRGLRSTLQRVGIQRSDAQYQVGSYRLDRRAFDTGPTWTDYLAQHTELGTRVRVRIYVRERGASGELRRSVERAAAREANILERFRHPGVVRMRAYESSAHIAGPALVFDYHPQTLRLDQYLTRFGEKLDILNRMTLVRQLAETVRSAHRARIHHRALSAHAVHVTPRDGAGSVEPAEDGETDWLTPRLRIADWQVAARHVGEQDGTASGRNSPTLTSHAAAHLSEGADPYLAPELTALRADAALLDVYGLGTLTYLVVTGQAPGASQGELVARLEAGEGLRPSSVVDGLPEDVDLLVQAATAYQPDHRPATVDEFLELLEDVEDVLTAPSVQEPTPSVQEPAPSVQEPAPAAPVPDKDPLDAVPGDVLAERWQVVRRLGTGSTSRVFLARDLSYDPADRRAKKFAVLKVAVSERHDAILEREAETLDRLRAHSGIIRLIEPEPQRIGGRTVLVTEYVGDEREESTESGEERRPRRREETVARQLRDRGRLTFDELDRYSDYLFGAVDFLEGEGVWHRDIKPDNIAIRVRPNRTKELVLIDFSLTGHPVQEQQAGTEGYLDPFLDQTTRPVYDAHAERYALAVTLHEMASRELPVWGNGRVMPRQTDPQQHPYPTVAADAFDPALRDGLVEFLGCR